MCFGRGLKGDDPTGHLNNDYNSRPVEPKKRDNSSKMPQNETYSPPAGPPPSQSYAAPATFSSNNPYAQTSNDYTPPPGPPPSHNEYSAPPGPPPSHNEYSAPPG